MNASTLEYNPPINSPPSSRKERPDLRTRHGHRLDEAVSALQKSIRRSHLDDSLYWACELIEQYPHYLWRRLKVILSEDVGIAEPHLPATIQALHSTYEAQRKEKGEQKGEMPTLHAVILLATAKKSRLVDNALIWHTGGPRDKLYREPPDAAFDRHTRRGREQGRSWQHFWEEAALLADPKTGELAAEGSVPDPYLELAHSVLKDKRSPNEEDA